MRSFAFVSFAAFAVASLLLSGCGPKEVNKPADIHAHGEHEHSHAHGIHDGHVMELGEEEYHAEWTHDDAGKIVFYILDKTMTKDVPIAAERIVINTKVGEKSGTYELEAVSPVDGKTAQFEITDIQLLTILTAIGEGNSASLEVPIDGKTYVQKFEKHDEHGHH